MKKKYNAPELARLGDIADITKGGTGRGNADSIWFFFFSISWGDTSG